jgi:redox-sensitive bicupin YhaK (pirin superfamily)
MITPRRSKERGYFDHGWLRTYHTFSFADYYDPRFQHFRTLRVINEDFVAEGMGFATHSHRDMEIITYVHEGTLSHKDSMGNGSEIKAGEVQYMSAGSGVTHSEFNHMKDKPVHLTQIWIFPDNKNYAPQYGQLHSKLADFQGKLSCVVSGAKKPNVLQIRQDADIYVGLFEKHQAHEQNIRSGRGVWIHVLEGELKVINEQLKAGDGAAIEAEPSLRLAAGPEGAHFLLFDLA